jgi:hypothetical protein
MSIAADFCAKGECPLMEPANNAKFSVDLTKRQMEQLDAKIAQQWKQIAEFQRMDNAALLLKAPQAFQKMQEIERG